MLCSYEPSYLSRIHSTHLWKGHHEGRCVPSTAWSCPSVLLFSTGPLCLAFGSRLHNSKWGNYLALIAESFDYFRSDVTVWLNYLIYLVWHIGVIRSVGQISSICFILACMDGFTGQVNTPSRLLHSSTEWWFIIKFYKLIWTFRGTWCRQSFINQKSLLGCQIKFGQSLQTQCVDRRSM